MFISNTSVVTVWVLSSKVGSATGLKNSNTTSEFGHVSGIYMKNIVYKLLLKWILKTDLLCSAALHLSRSMFLKSSGLEADRKVCQ